MPLSSEEILLAVANEEHRLDATADSVAAVVGLLERMSPGAADGLWTSYLALALRAIETRILCDPELRALALYWDALVGTADDRINARIATLTGVPAPPNLVAHLHACIRSRASREMEKHDLSFETFRDVVRTRVTEGTELRCTYCGYHFRPDDMGEPKRMLLEEAGAVLTQTLHPNRIVDALKPHELVVRNGSRMSLTRLSLDHVVPEAGFGWSDTDNLVFACQFCNSGRQIYRRGPEPLSVMLASSPSACSPERGHSPPRQISLVASILSNGRRCAECARTAENVELTATLGPSEVRDLRWLTFWNARVLCYECIEEVELVTDAELA
jgi:hypothetical protein